MCTSISAPKNVRCHIVDDGCHGLYHRGRKNSFNQFRFSHILRMTCLALAGRNNAPSESVVGGQYKNEGVPQAGEEGIVEGLHSAKGGVGVNGRGERRRARKNWMPKWTRISSRMRKLLHNVSMPI
jgi:hypothetical protein